jgi:hypothetical protein
VTSSLPSFTCTREAALRQENDILLFLDKEILSTSDPTRITLAGWKEQSCKNDILLFQLCKQHSTKGWRLQECSLLTMHLLWLNSARWCLPHMCCDHIIFCGQDLPFVLHPFRVKAASEAEAACQAYCCGSWDCWVTAEYWGFLQVKNKFVILFSLLLVLHVVACFHVVAGCVVLHHGSEYICSHCSWRTEQLATSCDLNGAGELKGGVL